VCGCFGCLVSLGGALVKVGREARLRSAFLGRCVLADLDGSAAGGLACELFFSGS